MDPHEDLGAQDASDGWCSTASASVAWMSWDALAPHRMLATLTRTQRQTLTGAPARFTERGAIARLDDGTWAVCGEPPEDLTALRHALEG